MSWNSCADEEISRSPGRWSEYPEHLVEDGKVYYNVSPAQVILDNGIFYIHSRSYANKIVKPLYEKKFIIKANKKVMRSDCFIRLNIEDLK